MTPADDLDPQPRPDDEAFDAWADDASPRPGATARPSRPGGAPRKRKRRRRRSRQTVALGVAAGLGSLLVAGVLLATLFAGKDAPAPPTQTVPPSTAPQVSLPRIVDGMDLYPTVPKGDYARYCTAVNRQLAANIGRGRATKGSPLAKAAAVYLALDFDALADVAPDGLQPALRTVGDGRDQVTKVLQQVTSLDDLGKGDLPEGWLEALILVSRATDASC